MSPFPNKYITTEIRGNPMENLLSNYRSKVSFMNKLQKKKAWLDKNKENRLVELEHKIPLQREVIKKEAKELYKRSEEYREKGFDKKHRLFMNEGSRKIKKLKAISRFRKMKEIHNLNHNISEIKERINPLVDYIGEQEKEIKDMLFNDFLGR